MSRMMRRMRYMLILAPKGYFGHTPWSSDRLFSFEKGLNGCGYKRSDRHESSAPLLFSAGDNSICRKWHIHHEVADPSDETDLAALKRATRSQMSCTRSRRCEETTTVVPSCLSAATIAFLEHGLEAFRRLSRDVDCHIIGTVIGHLTWNSKF